MLNDSDVEELYADTDTDADEPVLNSNQRNRPHDVLERKFTNYAKASINMNYHRRYALFADSGCQQRTSMWYLFGEELADKVPEAVQQAMKKLTALMLHEDGQIRTAAHKTILACVTDSSKQLSFATELDRLQCGEYITPEQHHSLLASYKKSISPKQTKFLEYAERIDINRRAYFEKQLELRQLYQQPYKDDQTKSSGASHLLQQLEDEANILPTRPSLCSGHAKVVKRKMNPKSLANLVPNRRRVQQGLNVAVHDNSNVAPNNVDDQQPIAQQTSTLDVPVQHHIGWVQAIPMVTEAELQ